MNNTWTFDFGDTGTHANEDMVKGAHREKDRRSRALEIVKYFKTKLDETYLPMTSMEYLSALFRQRGVPSLDSFTAELVGSVRKGFGFDTKVEGPIRKVLSVGHWMSSDSSVTMWLLEPVVSTVIIKGNTLDVSDAKTNFFDYINVVEPMTMSTSNTVVVNNEIKGRWAGWLTWKQLQLVKSGNPSCVHCNMSGTSIMFMVRHRNAKPVNLMMTPESIHVLSAYSKSVCRSMDMSSSLLASSSTKLKIQPALHVGRSTNVSLYGNGSMQVCGSPHDVESVVSCTFEVLSMVMDTEMIPFLETMRVASMQANGF